MVASYRGLEPEDVDAIGQGRVWSGRAAFEFGLVDSLGNIDDAIAAAASKAEVADYEVKYIEEKPGFSEKLAEILTAHAGFDLEQTRWRPGAVEGFMFEIARVIERLGLLNDPSQVYVLCEMCEVR